MNVRRGTIFFDSTCGLCSQGTRLWEPWVNRRGFVVEPFPLDDGGDRPDEMALRDPAGKTWYGVDALGLIARSAWYTWPAYPLTRLPVTRQVSKFLYRQIARRRGRISAACGLRPLNKPA